MVQCFAFSRKRVLPDVPGGPQKMDHDKMYVSVRIYAKHYDPTTSSKSLA